jgi:hypothetical protein
MTDKAELICKYQLQLKQKQKERLELLARLEEIQADPDMKGMTDYFCPRETTTSQQAGIPHLKAHIKRLEAEIGLLRYRLFDLLRPYEDYPTVPATPALASPS